MDSQWETVLIEWINCLNFCKPLQNVEELHDGVFFNNFQKIIKKSSDITCDDLTFIFDVLSRHYPKFEIKNKSHIHVSDLSKADLIHLTSLLLHYTCIHDRRNVLTSPMCYNLSSTTQQYIKTFLENINGEISFCELDCIIKGLFAENLKNQCQIFKSGGTPTTTNLLQDVLRTPTTRIKKLEEKDKEIQSLMQKLEIEKFDKADLEDDIKELSEKIVKLETKLKQKCSEITRLRCEVESLEMSQAPHFQEVDTRETQRLLKLELQDLEQYINQCQLEQEELRNERDIAKNYAKKIETDCTMWQKKFFESDSNLQNYSEHVKELERKNEDLQAHCVELEALLDEFRCKSPSSFEESTVIDSFPSRRSKSLEPLWSCEDLANSVVDVQLKETQKKLNEALERLENTIEAKIKCEEEIELYKIQVTNTEHVLKKTNMEKDQIQLKIEEISKVNEKLSNNVQELISAKDTFEKDLQKLSQALDETTLKFETSLEEKNDIDQILVNTQKNLEEARQDVTKLIMDKDIIEKELAKTDKELKDTQKYLSDTYKNLKEAQNNLEREKEERRDIENNWISTKRLLDETRIEIHKYESLTENISDHLDRMKKEKEIVNNQLENANETLKKTEDSLKETEENLKEILKEKDSLSKDVQRLQQLSDSLSEKLTQENAENVTLVKTLNQFKLDLAHSKQNHNETLMLKNQLEEELAELKKKNEDNVITMGSIKERLKQAKDIEAQLSTARLESEKLQRQKEETVVELDNKETRLQDALTKLNNQIEENEKSLLQVKELEDKLAQTNEDLLNTKKELDQTIRDKVTIEKETKKKLKNLKEIMKEKDSLSKDVQRLQQLSDSLLEKLKLENTENVTLVKTLSQFELDLAHSKQNHKETLMLKSQLEEELSELKKKHKENHILIGSIKDRLKQAKDIEAQLSMARLELEKLQQQKEETLVELDNKEKTLQNTLTKLNNQIEENKKNLVQVQELEDKLAQTNEDLLNTKKELDQTIRDKVIIEKETQKKIENLKETKKEKDSLSKDVQRLQQLSDSLLEKLKRENAENVALIETLSQLELDLAHSEQNYKETLMLKNQLEEELAELKKKNEDNVITMGSIKERLKQAKDIEAQLSTARLESEKLQRQKEETVVELDNKEKKIQDTLTKLNSQIENNEKNLLQVKELEDKLAQTNEDLLNTKIELDQTVRDKVIIEKETQKKQEDLKETMKEKDSLNKDIQRLQQLSDSLLEKLKLENAENVALLKTLSQFELDLVHSKQNLKETLMLKNQLEEELSELKKKHEDNVILMGSIKDIEAQLSTARLELEKLLKQKEDTLVELDNKEKKFQDTLTKLNNQIQKNEGNLLQIKKLEDKLAQMNEDLLNTKKKLDQVIRDTVIIERETLEKIKVFENTIINLEVCKRYDSAELDAERKEKHLLIDDLKATQADMEDTKATLKKVLTEKSDLEASFQMIMIEKTNTENELEKARINIDTLTKLNNQIEKNEKGLEDKIAETNEDLVNTKKELEQVIRDKVIIEKETLEKICVFEKTITNLKICKRNDSAELDTKRKEKLTLINDLKTIQVDVEETKETLRKVLIEKSDLEAAFEMIITEKTNIENELAKANINIDHYSTLLNNINSEFATATEETNNKKENLVLLAQQLEKSLGESEALSRTVEGTTMKLEELDCQNNVQEDKIRKLEDDLKNTEEEKRILLRSLDQTVEKLEIKEELLQELKGQTANTNAKLLETVQRLEQIQEEKTIISNFLDLNNSELAKVGQDKEQILEALEMSNKDKLDLIEENRTFKDRLEEMQEEINRYLCEMENKNDVELNYQKLYQKNSKMVSEKEKLLSDNAELLENVQKIIKEKQELFSELGKVSTTLEVLKKDHENLRVIYEETVKAKEDERNWGIKLEEFTKENVQLRREKDELNDKLKQFEKQQVNMLLSLELSQKETQKIKNERREILHSQTELMRETEVNIQRAHEAAVAEKKELLHKTEILEKDRQKLREAYASVVTNNAKQETEIVNLRKIIEERNNQIQQFTTLKDAYEKLLEENNKYMTDIDTIKFKRSKDREEFLNLLKKERDEAEAKQNKKVREVRTEYEEKLSKMKDKMIKLFREEVNKELLKVKSEQGEMACFQKTIDQLRNELFNAEEKIHMLEVERDMLKTKDNILSRESVAIPVERNGPKHSITNLRGRGNKVADRDSLFSTTNVPSVRNSYSRDQLQRLSRAQSRKTSTLPNKLIAGDFIEETVTFSRRTSINSIGQNLEMEDEEDDMFNTKYLVDLQEGRCIPHTGRESNVSRMSELAWRNSMVPPHLKSSYPAETQFVSPTRFREDDLKGGNVALYDSFSKLLPGEKPRQKKDFGTTTYKKPGPPTPSKNGGRLSLQGNEVAPLREVNHTSPPKKVTPGRLRALFIGRKDTGTRENTENVTPRASKRLSLFRNRK